MEERRKRREGRKDKYGGRNATERRTEGRDDNGEYDGNDPGLIFILNVAGCHNCMQLQQLWPVVQQGIESKFHSYLFWCVARCNC